MKKHFHITIGITAGIAAYKMLEVIKRLRSKHILVSLVLTKNAVKMFGTSLFSKEVGNRIFWQLIPPKFDFQKIVEKRQVEHIDLADSTNLLLIAPATADIIAKIAHGFADDYLTTLVLALTCPIVICPSMNTNMWHKKTVQENLQKLKNMGYYILPPDQGDLACGYIGIGRLKDLNKIEEFILTLLNKKNTLTGKKILVTSGGTSQPIDKVRIITNRSSGKMGKAIAEACHFRGADVLLLRARNSLSSDFNLPERSYETFSDLENLLEKFTLKYDIIFHSSAVSDYIPEKEIAGKLDSKKSFLLKLKPNVKLINKIKDWNPKITLIGFKAVFQQNEQQIYDIGQKLIDQSQADYVVVNDIGQKNIGFGSDYNEVYLIPKKGNMIKIKRDLKTKIAQSLLYHIFGV